MRTLKTIAVVFFLPFLLCGLTFLIGQPEFEGTYSCPLRWTDSSTQSYDEEPWEYLYFDSGLSKEQSKHFTYQRYHYGWPCWALYVDYAHSPSPEGHWAAKLDVRRMVVNFLVPLLLSVVLVLIYKWRRKRLAKTSTDSASV